MASISWTDTAQSNLIEISDYISLDSPFHAELLIEGIYKKAQILERFPEFGKKLRELPDKEYRELIYKSYRIIYKVQKETVYVMTIYHSARLLKNSPLFKDEL